METSRIRNIATEAQECLAALIAEAQACAYDEVNDENAEDALADAGCAADDIAVYLGSLRAILKEAGE